MDVPSPLVVRLAEVVPVDRGSGVRTTPLVGHWNSESTALSTGITEIAPGKGVPLHTHNVEEAVLVLSGSAHVSIGEAELALNAHDSTWIPADVPHRFANAGPNVLRIYWVYRGVDITRTMAETGETVRHLSSEDRVDHQADRSSGRSARVSSV